MKQGLENLISDNSVKGSHSTWSLLLTVLLKYGIAPIACIYLGYILMIKDALIQKNNETTVILVRELTLATTKQTSVMENLTKIIEANTKRIEEVDRKVK